MKARKTTRKIQLGEHERVHFTVSYAVTVPLANFDSKQEADKYAAVLESKGYEAFVDTYHCVDYPWTLEKRKVEWEVLPFDFKPSKGLLSMG